VKAVVMEVRFRVCATPRRASRFSDHAAHIVAAALPARVERDRILQPADSVLLRRQWARSNGESPPEDPQTLDIGFGFHDPAGRLTTHKLESMANTVLVDLMPTGDSTEESVPWILTLNAGIDQASCAAIAEQYSALSTARTAPRRPVTAASGPGVTYD
jgi:hypothetical protein